MSNAIRYDALLIRDLADELNRALKGVRLDAVLLERESLRVTIHTRARRRSAPPPPGLLWQLHPTAGHLTPAAREATRGGIALGASTTIARVHAPPDERIIIFELEAPDAPAGAARRIVIELITNQWNALALGAEDRITAVLRERETRGRVLRAGRVYQPPARSPRIGAAEPIDSTTWRDQLGSIPPGERLAALLRFAAYTSPLNAAHILGSADVDPGSDALEPSRERYEQMIWTGPRAPVLLRLGEHWQPYSQMLPGAGAGTADVDSLLDAFRLAAEYCAAAPAESSAADRALEALQQRLESIERRASRLREEQAGSSVEAAQLRQHADLLLAQLHRVERGATHVSLDDFAGGAIDLELDGAQSAADNASRLYDSARRRDRASARIPGLLKAGAKERARIEQLIERVRAGACTAEELQKIQPQGHGTDRAAGPALPYREYRTSGGLEVRVGRGSRANDELTFRHSRPSDVWLHARDVAGAHVILRWDRNEENPPAAAIAEAAVLAALHSRARTSGTVAVDWTRRKHVRKPRKSAPGLVIPERVRTVFVEPDAALEEKMRAER